MRAVKAAVQAFQAVLGPTADTLVGGVRVDCLGHKKGATLNQFIHAFVLSFSLTVVSIMLGSVQCAVCREMSHVEMDFA